MGKDLGFKSHFNLTLYPENAALGAVVLHETEGLTSHTEKQKPEQAWEMDTEATAQDSLLTSWHL